MTPISKEFFLTHRFCDLNNRFFDNKLNLPVFYQDRGIECFGCYLPKDDFLCIRYDLFQGDGKVLRTGSQYQQGRLCFVESVLLHEIIHKFLYKITNLPHTVHDGLFANECNRIGKRLGFKEVFPKSQFRTWAAMAASENTLLCNHWPYVAVNTDEYYLGAYIK